MKPQTFALSAVTITPAPEPLSEAGLALVTARLAKLWEQEVERALLAGYPRGYDTRTGMPGALHADAKPGPYGCIIDIDYTGS